MFAHTPLKQVTSMICRLYPVASTYQCCLRITLELVYNLTMFSHKEYQYNQYTLNVCNTVTACGDGSAGICQGAVSAGIAEGAIWSDLPGKIHLCSHSLFGFLLLFLPLMYVVFLLCCDELIHKNRWRRKRPHVNIYWRRSYRM